MDVRNVEECISEIQAYVNGEPTGHALIVNTDNYDVYQKIWNRLVIDPNIDCTSVSAYCHENVWPREDDIMEQLRGNGCYAISGFSQYLMLRGALALKNGLRKLLELSLRGHAIVLVEHCEHALKELRTYLKYAPRILLVEAEPSPLPSITLAKDAVSFAGYSHCKNGNELLKRLEILSEQFVREHPEIRVVLPYNTDLFHSAVYAVSEAKGLFDSMVKQYPSVGAALKKEYGSDDQWSDMLSRLKRIHSIAGLIEELFGSTVNLASHIRKVFSETDSQEKWYLWIGMKIYETKNNAYLEKVMKNSSALSDFIDHVYFDLLDFDHLDNTFSQLYCQRKRLIEDLPEDTALMQRYCVDTGRYGKDAVYYLTDTSEQEEYELMRCLSINDYTESEIRQIAFVAFPNLYSYLEKFSFNQTNTRIPEGSVSLLGVLTEYFQSYKLQKVTNRVFPEFMEQVKAFADSRPYNILQPRSSVVQKLQKDHLQPVFFDALGVEYLAYILARCDHYGLIAEVSISHCALPSITSMNKEFYQQFSGPILKNEDLDELKHHSQIIDYRTCKLPIHLFRELEIIDEELRRIRSKMVQGEFEKAVILSDHGASRLAVISEQESGAMLQLEENGIHSGRCCPTEEDPHIPFAAYENGYSVLANYDRFKGSRKANIEVHGGASLEEVLVPVIVLSRKPESIELYFIDPVVVLKGREPASITLYSNIPLSEPKMVVNGTVYSGEFMGDQGHVRFVMPDMKRSRKLTADIFDGEKQLAAGLSFQIQKATKEKDLF